MWVACFLLFLPALLEQGLQTFPRKVWMVTGFGVVYSQSCHSSSTESQLQESSCTQYEHRQPTQRYKNTGWQRASLGSQAIVSPWAPIASCAQKPGKSLDLEMLRYFGGLSKWGLGRGYTRPYKSCRVDGAVILPSK